MNIIIKKQKLEKPGIDPSASRMLIEGSTTWANPHWEMILFTNLFLISSWVAICNEYNYKETEIGESGYRSRWLPNTNRAFYQLSYWPIIYLFPRALKLKMNIISIGEPISFERLFPHWFYSPIFSLYPRELAMNIIIKKKKLENPGIDPGASRMQIERSTTWANPPCALDSIDQSFTYSLVHCNLQWL